MDRPLTTSRWLRETFSIFAAQAGPVLGITGAIYAPFLLLAIAGIAVDLATPEVAAAWELWSNLSQVVLVFVAPLASAAVVEAVFRHLRGERVEAGRSLRVALGRFFALLGLTILVGMATSVGYLMCLVPGVIVQCALFAAPPALIVERARVLGAWRRSFDLTDGYRWPIFGVVFLLGLLSVGIGMLLGVLAVALASEQHALMIVTVGTLVVSWVGTALSAIAATLVYHDLRVVKEGIGEEELVAVFA